MAEPCLASERGTSYASSRSNEDSRERCDRRVPVQRVNPLLKAPAYTQSREYKQDAKHTCMWSLRHDNALRHTQHPHRGGT